MNAIRLVSRAVPAEPALGVAVEGSTLAWPGGEGRARAAGVRRAESAALLAGRLQSRRHAVRAHYHAGRAMDSAERCASGAVEKETRLWVSVDWSKAPKGIAGQRANLGRERRRYSPRGCAQPGRGISRSSLEGFAEGAGYVSMEAEH